MKRSALGLIQNEPSTKRFRNTAAHPDQLTMILHNAMVVFQRALDLASTTFTVPELPAAGQIGIEIVEIVRVSLNDHSRCFMSQIERSRTENARESGGTRRTREKYSTATRRSSEDHDGRKCQRHGLSSWRGFEWVRTVRLLSWGGIERGSDNRRRDLEEIRNNLRSLSDSRVISEAGEDDLEEISKCNSIIEQRYRTFQVTQATLFCQFHFLTRFPALHANIASHGLG